MHYVAGGGTWDVAQVGQPAADDIPDVRELLLRIVLRKPPLRTLRLGDSGAKLRLSKLHTKPNLPDVTELGAVH